VTLAGKEAGSESTILVDQCHVGEDAEDGANTPKDKPMETVAQKSAVDPLGELDRTPLLGLREPEEPLVKAGELDAIVNAVGESGNSRLDSPREAYDAVDLENAPNRPSAFSPNRRDHLCPFMVAHRRCKE